MEFHANFNLNLLNP